jgi:nicotinamidase/pyrazinamidase
MRAIARRVRDNIQNESKAIRGMTMTKALIVVDVQPTFCESGELGVAGGNKDTALDAKKLGFEDLTVPVSEELGVAARKQMAAGGITLAESR